MPRSAKSALVQLIDEHGARTPHRVYDPFVTDLDDDALAGLYEDMVLVRRIDAEGMALQRQGELGLWPPLLGQEAAQIGLGRALRPDDFVFTSYREHGVAYCRGVAPVELLRVWRGVAVSGWDPYAVNLAPQQVIIGAQGLHATGYALGILADRERDPGTPDSVAVACFGDGAMSEGDVSEAMVFAASYRAPVVFFCQNNQYAISEPVALQTRVPLADRPGGFGIPGVRVDGNDVLAVTAAVREALARARRGDGPGFIEAVTYRMGPHTTADDPTRYRDESELEQWRGRDPIARLRTLLETRGAFGPELEERVAARADEIAAELRSGLLALADPEPLEVFADVYAEPHPELERQREEYARYLAGFAS